MRLSLNKEDAAPHGHAVRDTAWGRPTPGRFAVRVHLHQGRAFPPQDGGLFSPFVRATLAGEQADSGVWEGRGTLSPVWYKTLTLDVEMPKERVLAPHLHLELFHKPT